MTSYIRYLWNKFDIRFKAHDFILIEYLEDVKSVLRIYKLATGADVTNIPIDIGSVSSVSFKRESTELFFSFTSFTTPTTIYTVDLSDMSSVLPKLFRQSAISGFNSFDFETRQVFYDSKDGTKVPMFVISRKGLELNSQSSCILYAYGSHGRMVLPGYSSMRIPWLTNYNGIYCVANVRGGGEYGQDWHYSGRRANKQNTYDDFIAAAECLINKKYTCKDWVSTGSK